MLFCVLLFFSAASNVPAAQDRQIAQKLAALEKLPRKFSFVVLGDNRSGGDIYRKLLSGAMERKPDLIVNTGDQIASPGSISEWNTFWDLSRTVAVPYFLTVGNHDVHPDAPGSEMTYREQADLPGNELYYSFVAGNSLFVVLDSNLSGQEKRIRGEQYAWLERVLAGSKEKLKFVFLHHPLFPGKGIGRHYGNCMDRYPAERDRLQALFAKHRVTAVFTGHEHLYRRTVVGGIAHIITGGGGAPLYADEPNGGFHHYLYMKVDGDAVSGEAVDVNGKVRDRF